MDIVRYNRRRSIQAQFWFLDYQDWRVVEHHIIDRIRAATWNKPKVSACA